MKSMENFDIIDYGELFNDDSLNSLKLNDKKYITPIVKTIENSYDSMLSKLKNQILIEKRQNIRAAIADELISSLDTLINEYKNNTKKSIIILSHISDITNKTNSLTSAKFYEKLNSHIQEEVANTSIKIRSLIEKMD